MARLLVLLVLAIPSVNAQVASRDLLVNDLRERLGDQGRRELGEAPFGAEFLAALEGDEAWLRELLDSGPVTEPRKVLAFLRDVWAADQELVRRPVDRSMATAAALALGMRRDADAVWMRRRYEYYRDSFAAGLLNADYEPLATWERRFLARGCQWRWFADVEALEFLRDEVSLPRSEYPGACWRAPYRGFNCLGDTVQGPAYYFPFQGSYSCGPEMAIHVGGVCGALSNLGASAAMANGIPALTMGEPGHCAYAVKTDGKTWTSAYSLSWKRSLHTSFYEPSWPSLMLTEACFSQPSRVRKASDLARRARDAEARGQVAPASNLWRRATKAHGLHYELWLGRADFGARTQRHESWWRRLHDDVLAGLADHEGPAWTVLSRRVHPNLLPSSSSEERLSLFLRWVRTLDRWGGGRWPVEGAWDAILRQLDEKDRERFLERATVRLVPSGDFGPVFVAWLLAKDSGSAQWEKRLGKILRATASPGEAPDRVLTALARKLLPACAARGDVDTFQRIGKVTQRLGEPQPMTGLAPFPGTLLSDGGLLQVSGTGNRWDTPEHHWGVLGDHGGHCHTDNGKSFIAVKLEQFGELTGLVIQNRAGAFKERAHGARVEVSDDGKTWTTVATLTGAKDVYRVDLSEKRPRCAWVRLAKDTNCLHLRRFLVYGHRRS